jgi:hypothetical protein
MKCHDAAKFVSALCDGEKISREAAEHIGACEPCRTRMRQYAEMGAELRRVASLESLEDTRVRRWEKDRKIMSNWWLKGWETMRIPRLAFALLLIAVAVLGSSLVIVRVRAQTQGKALMLTAKPADSHSLRCALSLAEKEGAACTFVQMAEGSGGLYGFRIISNDGDRIQLGIRALANLSARGRSVTSDEVKGLPETSVLVSARKVIAN